MPDLSKLTFYSDVNYMKRSEFCDSALLTLPSYGNSVSKVITHNLGILTQKVPFFEVMAELDEAETIWHGGKVSELTDQGVLSGLGADPTYVDIQAWSTPTALTITLYNFTSPTATGTRRIYWLIYRDYDKN